MLKLLVILSFLSIFVDSSPPFQVKQRSPGIPWVHSQSNQIKIKSPLVSELQSQEVEAIEAIELPVHSKDKNVKVQEKKNVENPENFEIEPRLRLNRQVIPTKYDLEIQPILENSTYFPNGRFTAPGKVTIRTTCLEATSTIVMHSIMREIGNISVSMISNGQIIGVDRYVQDAQPSDTQFLTISLQSELIPGEDYLIIINFVAKIIEDFPIGLYVTDLTGEDPDDNSTRFITTTQFAPTYARYAFPSFDEPNHKAIFSIKIKRLAKHISLSNANLLTSIPIPGMESEGWVEDTFNATVAMSTYLVALIVCDFQYKESTFRNIPVRTYAPGHLIEEATYSAELSAKVTPFYEELLEFQYPMLKVDSIALPYFYFGAMENWGMICYRSNFLLYNENKTTELERYSIDNIIAHEIAHFHFGFATYMSYLGMINEEFEPRKMFVIDAIQLSKQVDARPTSHPVIDESVQTPDQILANYDDITYEKAASLIHMMNGILTEETFLKGIRRYIQRHQFDNVLQDDLFQVLTEVAHEDQRIPTDLTVKDIMDSWTLKKGFPLMRVSRGGPQRILITQEKYQSDPEEVIETSELWYAPIDYQVDGADIKKIWMPQNRISTTLEHDTSKFIILNPDSYGYYRVLYDSPLKNLIKTQLFQNSSVFNPITRSQLLDDYFSLAYDQYVDIGEALDMTVFLDQEAELVVFQTLFNHITKIYLMMLSSDFNYQFVEYYKPKFEAALLNIGLETQPGDKGNKVILRSLLLDWVCTLESQICFDYSMEHYRTWVLTGSHSIPLEQRDTVFCGAVSAGGFETFDFFLQKYHEETDNAVKEIYVRVLGCTREYSLLKRMLDLSMDETNGFNKTHGVLAVQSVTANTLGRTAAFGFIREDHVGKVAYFGWGIMSSVYNTFSVYWNTDYSDLYAFIAVLFPQMPADHQRVVAEAVQIIFDNYDWFQMYKTPLKSWFDLNVV